MIESPDVAILQHASGVMQVVHNLFENGSQSQLHASFPISSDRLTVTYFTNLIYTSIQFAVGNGDCAPVSIKYPPCDAPSDKHAVRWT
jgi:hypothetical protein